MSISTFGMHQHLSAYLHRFPPQHKEGLCTLGQEARELVYQYMLYLVCLLDLYADAHTVDARFDKHPLVLVSRYSKWVKKHLGGARSLDLGNIVSF